MRVIRRPFVLFLASLTLLAGSLAVAEDLDINSLFDGAKTAYAEKRYGKALEDLKLLVSEIGRLRMAQLAAALPAAPQGWTAEEADSDDSSAAMAMFGGGVNIERRFTKGEDARVTVQLMADSPLLMSMATLMSNPQFLPAGTKIVTVKGRKAMLEVQAEDKQATLTLLLAGNTAMLKVEGRGVEKADVVDVFGAALDVEKIEKALQN